jgi:TatD DNase family protein
MTLVDTHCHIHESSYPLDADETVERARQAGVTQMICVGTNEQSSEEAIAFVQNRDGMYASIGVHPHDTKDGWEKLEALAMSSRSVAAANKHLQPEHKATLGPDFAPSAKPLVSSGSGKGEREVIRLADNKLVAVGEIGLDYFYTHSPREVQIKALEGQIDLALRYNLPIIFHVREAFDDFWPIFDNFKGIRGELHSFTDSVANLEQGLKRGLYVGVNGISTFTKSDEQRALFATIPLEKLLLETDAPFLTPAPFRGKVNEPAFVKQIAEFHAGIRNVSTENIADVTTANAQALFNLS